MRAFFSLIDSLFALFLTILLIFAFCMQNSWNTRLTFESQVVYYKKVAEQILMTSAMKGYVTELIDAFELRYPLKPALEKMLLLSPKRLSCLLEVRNPEGSILCSTGHEPVLPVGLAEYFASTNLGLLRIVCSVGSS